MSHAVETSPADQARALVRSPFDEPVIYHGSLTEHHGPAVKVGECGCLGLPYQECRGQLDDVEHGDPWAIRWVLRLPDGSRLLCVRPSSFTHVGRLRT